MSGSVLSGAVKQRRIRLPRHETKRYLVLVDIGDVIDHVIDDVVSSISSIVSPDGQSKAVRRAEMITFRLYSAHNSSLVDMQTPVSAS